MMFIARLSHHFRCVALITLHTFEIKEPLFTEPLLYLSSGQPGGLYQPVNLSHSIMEHK